MKTATIVTALIVLIVGTGYGLHKLKQYRQTNQRQTQPGDGLPRFLHPGHPRFPYWPEGGYSKRLLQRHPDGSWVYPQYHAPNPNPDTRQSSTGEEGPFWYMEAYDGQGNKLHWSQWSTDTTTRFRTQVIPYDPADYQ